MNIKAQRGDLFLHNYSVPIKNIDSHNQAVVQGAQGLMYFANKKGIMSYDGVSWQIIKTVNTPYVLAVHPKSEARVYVGCRESFGYLDTHQTGEDHYVSFSESQENIGEINRIALTDNYVYFYSDQALFVVSLKGHKVVKTWRSSRQQTFLGLVQFKDKVYLNLENRGLHQIQENQLVPVRGSEDLGKEYIRASFAFDASRSLLATSRSKCYLFNGNQLILIRPSAYEYLQGNIIHEGLSVSDNVFALATISGGVVLINKQTYQTEHIINYQTGLPDDEVYAISLDAQKGLWVCHAEGISRADMELPIRTFSSYIGLSGNLETVSRFNDSLYVATSDGLYYLSKVDRFEEIERLIKKEQKYLKTIESVVRTVKISEPRSNNRNEIRDYTHSQNGQKVNKRKILIDEEVEVKKVPTKTHGTQYIRALYSSEEARKAYAIQSIPYVYKEVVGIDSKCRQIVTYRNRMLVASNLGLYEVIRNKEDVFAKPVLEQEYINLIVQSKSTPNYFYICTNTGVILLALEGNNWVVKDEIGKRINSNINSLVEFKNDLWLGSESRLFRISLDSAGQFGKIKKYIFTKSYSEDVAVALLRDTPTFLLSSGIYSYSERNGKIHKNPRLQKYFSPRSKVLFNQESYVWLKNVLWLNLKQPTNQDSLKISYLEFFDQVHDIYVDGQKNIWAVADNNLYRILNNDQPFGQTHFDIFIRNIFQKPDTLLPLNKTVFEYSRDGQSFSFKMASPFYQRESSIQYQYWLEGLGKGWSDWDSQAIISFPYLPSGEYRLHVRARNIYGQISEEQIYAFKINPPFWETTWFYGLQISVLVGLLLLSFLFNRRGQSSPISYLLTLVSIITVFEFCILLLEPYVERFSNGVPFFKLTMNILLALSLAPAEHLLKKWLHKSKTQEPAKAQEAV
ncbi:MAG: hypothetical protein HC880_14615 [Bacteroidia bacterium]|nr:hypothetical protein [Bacteroidia bacterium]